jgi:hypothetical protein
MKTWGTGGTSPQILKLGRFTVGKSYIWRLSSAEFMISSGSVTSKSITLSTRGVHLVIRMLGKILYVVGSNDML